MPDLAARLSDGAIAALEDASSDRRVSDLSRLVLRGGASRFASVVDDNEPIHYVVPVRLAGTTSWGALVLQNTRAGLVWRDSHEQTHARHVLLTPTTEVTHRPVRLDSETWAAFRVDDGESSFDVLVPRAGRLTSTVADHLGRWSPIRAAAPETAVLPEVAKPPGHAPKQPWVRMPAPVPPVAPAPAVGAVPPVAPAAAVDAVSPVAPAPVHPPVASPVDTPVRPAPPVPVPSVATGPQDSPDSWTVPAPPPVDVGATPTMILPALDDESAVRTPTSAVTPIAAPLTVRSWTESDAAASRDDATDAQAADVGAADADATHADGPDAQAAAAQTVVLSEVPTALEPLTESAHDPGTTREAPASPDEDADAAWSNPRPSGQPQHDPNPTLVLPAQAAPDFTPPLSQQAAPEQSVGTPVSAAMAVSPTTPAPAASPSATLVGFLVGLVATLIAGGLWLIVALLG